MSQKSRENFFVISSLIALAIAAIATVWFDSTELTPYNFIGLIQDKWHEESCMPNYDASGNYYGDTCSDNWVLVLNLQGKRVKQNVSNNRFHEFKIGNNVRYSYSLGKLGFKHNTKIEML